MNKALGLIEVVGYAPAMAAVDAAVKTANVNFLGFETVIGAAKKVTLTVKLEGEVAAVKAAVDAGAAAAKAVGEVFASHVIPRPHSEIDRIVFSNDTLASLRNNCTEKRSSTEGEKKTRKTSKQEQP